MSRESGDENLPKEAAAGAPEALERFVERHWERVHRVAYLISCDRAEAEDIAQEAMIKALRALPEIDTERPIEPWLDRVAANAARDWLRSRARRGEILQHPPAEPDPEPDGDILAEITQHTLPAELTGALGRLEPGFREVVVLRHLLEMGTEEIAAHLGIAPATVRSRDHRALRLLRSELGERQGTDA